MVGWRKVVISSEARYSDPDRIVQMVADPLRWQLQRQLYMVLRESTHSTWLTLLLNCRSCVGSAVRGDLHFL